MTVLRMFPFRVEVDIGEGKGSVEINCFKCNTIPSAKCSQENTYTWLKTT